MSAIPIHNRLVLPVLYIFLLDIFFICTSNVIPLPGFPYEKHLSPPPSVWSPTHLLLLPGPGNPIHRGIELSQDQVSLLPLMTYKAILFYICSRIHESHLFGWWLNPWQLWGYWLVHIVVSPKGLQTPSSPCILSLAPSLGTLCSVQREAASIHLCICQALVKPGSISYTTTKFRHYCIHQQDFADRTLI